MSQESQAISDNISMLLTQGRTAEARAELERLLALDPDDPEGRSVAGDVYAYTGAHSAAYKQYNLAAETYNRLGRADKALAVHHKILELDSGMLDAATQTRLRLLALLVGAEDAIVSGQHERAVAGFQEAIRQFPNHTITYQRLASLLVRMGKVDEAAAQYLTVARAFHAHGVHAKARPYFERVLELRPDHPEALERLMESLRSDGAEAEGERFVKAAAVAHLQAGRNEEAAALFESLPDAQREGASALGASLLLQSGEVGQAERMAAQLELARPELRDWFKRLGRAALERGDSVAADAYFRWAQGEAQTQAPVPAASPVPAPPATAAAVPPPSESAAPQAPGPPLAPPQAPALPKAPPPGLGAPPPPGLGVPPPPGSGAPPPPGLGVPPPPPPVAAPVPVPAIPVPAAPPASAPAAPVAEAPPLPAQGQAPEARPAAVPVISAGTPSTEDQGILQTMGEMCLAEEMFEEAKQVFERLTKADPSRTQFWEQLNRARAGLGLSPVMPPASSPRPSVPLPVHLVATTQAPLAKAPAAPVAAAPVAAPPPLAPPPALAPPQAPAPASALPTPPAPGPALPVPTPASALPEASAPETPVWLPGMDPAAEPLAAEPAPQLSAPQPPTPTPAPAIAPVQAVPAPVPAAASAGAFKPVVLPRRPAVAAQRVPARSLAPAVPAASGRIERAAYTMQLGELPPAVPSALDEADEIIE